MENQTKGVKTLLGDPKKTVIKLAIPMIIAMSVQTIYNFVDALWVSGFGAGYFTSVVVPETGKGRRVRVPVGPFAQRLVGIKLLDDFGGIANGDAVCRDGLLDHGADPDNAVPADGYPLADDGAVADPDIFANGDGRGVSYGPDPVVNAVPVRIGDVGAAGDHAVVADGNRIG